MSYTEAFAQKGVVNTASRIDNFTDVGGPFGFYINNEPVTGNNASQLEWHWWFSRFSSYCGHWCRIDPIR